MPEVVWLRSCPAVVMGNFVPSCPGQLHLLDEKFGSYDTTKRWMGVVTWSAHVRDPASVTCTESWDPTSCALLPLCWRLCGAWDPARGIPYGGIPLCYLRWVGVYVAHGILRHILNSAIPETCYVFWVERRNVCIRPFCNGRADPSRHFPQCVGISWSKKR